MSRTILRNKSSSSWPPKHQVSSPQDNSNCTNPIITTSSIMQMVSTPMAILMSVIRRIWKPCQTYLHRNHLSKEMPPNKGASRQKSPMTLFHCITSLNCSSRDNGRTNREGTLRIINSRQVSHARPASLSRGWSSRLNIHLRMGKNLPFLSEETSTTTLTWCLAVNKALIWADNSQAPSATAVKWCRALAAVTST